MDSIPPIGTMVRSKDGKVLKVQEWTRVTVNGSPEVALVCLLPPYDDVNRFEGQLLADLELEADKKAKAK